MEIDAQFNAHFHLYKLPNIGSYILWKHEYAVDCTLTIYRSVVAFDNLGYLLLSASVYLTIQPSCNIPSMRPEFASGALHYFTLFSIPTATVETASSTTAYLTVQVVLRGGVYLHAHRCPVRNSFSSFWAPLIRGWRSRWADVLHIWKHAHVQSAVFDQMIGDQAVSVH